MTLHRRIDHLFVGLSALIMRRAKFFRTDMRSDSLAALTAAIRVQIPQITGEGTHEPVLESPVGGLDPAYLVAQWRGPDWPCVIYHHGNNERPFDFGTLSVHSFKNIIMGRRGARQNLHDRRVRALAWPRRRGTSRRPAAGSEFRRGLRRAQAQQCKRPDDAP